MSLNKNNYLLFFILFCSSLLFSQEVEKDSTKTENLKEVVVTGQINPTSIKKSVHNVTVIKREQIDAIAANNIADLLNFNLNLTVIPNSQTGRSTISFFGLDAQYFNILIDNIPLVSDNGIGNNIDLTQINLDNVERIEIVEGSMGVEYGANAVSGVINIITKKSMDKDWNLQAFVQEETVSDEYEWFDKGRHIQSANLAHNFSDKWYGRIGFNRNDFAGFYNNRLGRDHYVNDGRRGYEWLPKLQLNTNAFLNYKSNKFNASYRFEYFKEDVFFYDAAVRANIDVESQTSNPVATDRIFTTNRFVNNLNIDGHFDSGISYNAVFSYQQQKRNLNQFTYFILTEDKTDETDETNQSSGVFFSRGTLNNLWKSDNLNFQLGYETRFNKGFDAQSSGGDITELDRERTQNNYAIFTTSEWDLTKSFSLRPGLRYEYNTLFHSKLMASLSARYLMKNGFELRGNIGSSYRTPNFEELYFYFVDTNHDVRGNENLKPEDGYTAFVNLKKHSWFNDINMVNNLKLSYVDVTDRIELAVVNELPLQFQYININAFKLWGVTLENSLQKNNWSFNLGATLQGISRELNDEANGNDDFLYAYQINTNFSYRLKPWNTMLSLLFKYNGRQQTYSSTGETDEDGNAIFTKSTIDGYGWLDASIRQPFLNNALEVTLGARNLLDVTNVNVSNATTGGVHATDNSSRLLGYGQSFYIKLLYNLNFLNQ